jgi:hypothetical protein
MAPGSATHGFDQNQRYVGLDYKLVNNDSESIEIFGPANEMLAPVGQYVLYLVSDSGIPSRGVSVRLTR